MAQKVIISCALTGSGDTVDKNPAVPVTPEQIARSALDARAAGAAIVHIHVRDPGTGKASRDPALYREVVTRIRDAGSDVIINLTTGAGARFVPGDNDPRTPAAGTTLTTPNERVAHVEELRPEICSLDMGSMNFGQHVFVNTPKHLQVMARAAKSAGVKPELEVFEAGHIRLARHMIEQGDIAAPALFQICLGIPWGAPADPASMTYMRDQLPPGSQWAAFGISSQQFPMVAQAVLLGGHVRVGLEDNLYLERGVLAPSNAALVEKAVDIVTLLGASAASPGETRDILNLPQR
ncbi:MAG TPA: 3-keto-5-aminohexanoate cleavage protein [Alphaproteobacteria bacterium]|nr:3-keto-5-aminohexanoate cleavage protein [Alphaproteobacteria bacterium]